VARCTRNIIKLRETPRFLPTASSRSAACQQQQLQLETESGDSLTATPFETQVFQKMPACCASIDPTCP
jgi:hypothetical protein